MTCSYEPYEPQLFPVAWAPDIWTVEGPEVNYRLAGITIPCPTRMTVVRLSDGKLWLHSPVCYSAALATALEELGKISALVAPNSYHYINIGKWAEAYPSATVFAAPDLASKISVKTMPIDAKAEVPWNSEIMRTLIDLGRFTEAVFFHTPSSTLIVTDLMQNFEARRVRRLTTRAILRAGGATGPNGRASIEIRLVARGHRDALRAGVQQMLDWKPTGIIIAHGACYREKAKTEIERAFDWVD